MTKITIGVSKVYKNSGSFRFHRKKTKLSWKHYFLDDETGNWKFGTEQVSSIRARILKLNIWKKRKAYCFECRNIFDAYIKNDNDQVECPYCL